MSSIAEEGWKGGNEIIGPAGRGDSGLHSTPRGERRQRGCCRGLLAMGSARREDLRAPPPAPCTLGALAASSVASPDREGPPRCPAPGICPCRGRSLRRSTAARGTQKLTAAALLWAQQVARCHRGAGGHGEDRRLRAALSFIQPRGSLVASCTSSTHVPDHILRFGLGAGMLGTTGRV